MLPTKLTEKINSLATLNKAARANIESSAYNMLENEINSLTFTAELWLETFNLVSNFSRGHKGQIYRALYSRAFTSKQSDLVEQHVPCKQKKKARLEKEIWEKILLLDKSKRITFTAKERWERIADFIASPLFNRKKTTVRLLRPKFWREAYWKGEFASIDCKWFVIWRSSHSSLNYKAWCAEVGILNLKIAYYTPAQQAKCKVSINNGKLNKIIDESLLDTQNGYIDCVMSAYEELYCQLLSPEDRTNTQHSSILSGQAVLFAGELSVKAGKLKAITLNSGHYCPEKNHLINFLQVLKTKGVDLNKVNILDEKHKVISLDAASYLLNYQALHSTISDTAQYTS